MAAMKIQFSSDLDYQQDAISAITGVFDGQKVCNSRFTVAAPGKGDLFAASEFSDLGIGNRLQLLNDDLLENIQAVQLANGLKESSAPLANRDFTIEMETGTGKTYVYLRSIFELNQQFGFTKFIIVVPSVAIKEGVYKTLQITEDHFKNLYTNIRYDYFVYDSAKREQVRSFATNDYVQIMVINIDAFRKGFESPDEGAIDLSKNANLIHRPDDRLSGMKPIEFIKSTNPILIIDEPQSVDTTAKSKEAIKSLNPLCTFRFSATHIEKHHQLYKLDSIDAYERKLVKQIEVASLEMGDSHNNAYIKLFKVDNKKSPITAEIEIDVIHNGKADRIKKKVKSGDDLLEISGGREVYDGYVVNDIYCASGDEYIDFTSKPDVIRLGENVGGVDEDSLKRLQVRKTIEEHLEKELLLNPMGIKVLSLFFIDRVANYRAYDAEGNAIKGKYAQWFEEEYKTIATKPKFKSLFGEVDLDTLATEIHNGYFATDKKKIGTKSVEIVKDSSGSTAADDSAYNLIMKDKEKLLSFDSKLRFIFSHSALREGWDNPNVFQICTLNESTSVIKKRQEIGRGMRLAVNQQGERIHGFEVNTLTVMANESYEDFVKKLQKEIEADEGIRFGVVEQHQFANIVSHHEGDKPAYLGAKTSELIHDHLTSHGYIDAQGKVQDALKIALKSNTVDLPESVANQSADIIAILKKVAGGLNVKNNADKRPIKLNKQLFIGEDFKALWDKIKFKTVYRVNFDSEKLIEKCAEEIKKNLIVGKSKFIYTTANVKITQGGLEGVDAQSTPYTNNLRDYDLPDVVGYLQDETNLTRKSIIEILLKSEKLESFKNNPQKFIEQATSIIKMQMRLFITDGIKYRKIGNDQFFAQELFETEELMGYLNKNMLEAKKSVYDHVIYDSDVEQLFASSCEKNTAIKVYAKLPAWFKIDTPLGSYNPDWAILVDQDGKERLYFVVETKGSLLSSELRPIEQAKIDCGAKHFEALGGQVHFTKADSFESFSSNLA